MRKQNAKWYLHRDHGYMLRGPVDKQGYQAVICAVCMSTRREQKDKTLWEAHKLRLYVNAGCNAVCADLMRAGDHNPAFKRVSPSRVPEWIKTDFVQYL